MKTNHSASPRQAFITGEAVPAQGGKTACVLKSDPIELEAGATKIITVRQSWKNPILWWPDQPRLCQLRSAVVENGKIIDQESRRFGFRELCRAPISLFPTMQTSRMQVKLRDSKFVTIRSPSPGNILGRPPRFLTSPTSEVISHPN